MSPQPLPRHLGLGLGAPYSPPKHQGTARP
jgi:hypothetical protein